MKRWLVLGVLAWLGSACGAPDPCEGVPCSEGRVCVLRERKVSCELADAGAP